jgi:hypothetical protein
MNVKWLSYILLLAFLSVSWLSADQTKTPKENLQEQTVWSYKGKGLSNFTRFDTENITTSFKNSALNVHEAYKTGGLTLVIESNFYHEGKPYGEKHYYSLAALNFENEIIYKSEPMFNYTNIFRPYFYISDDKKQIIIIALAQLGAIHSWELRTKSWGEKIFLIEGGEIYYIGEIIDESETAINSVTTIERIDDKLEFTMTEGYFVGEKPIYGKMKYIYENGKLLMKTVPL